jgi:hypothetical protein
VQQRKERGRTGKKEKRIYRGRGRGIDIKHFKMFTLDNPKICRVSLQSGNTGESYGSTPNDLN